MGLDLQVTTVQMIILLFFNTAEVSDEVLKQLKMALVFDIAYLTRAPVRTGN